MNYRIETDSVGSLEVPANAYYGIHALRAKRNFNISGQPMNPEFICSIAQVKKAAAMTNRDSGELPQDKAAAIISACDEIIAGELRGEFIVDMIQGGAGTSANMNANEVIANRAIELLGGVKGDYSIVHPNDHVNMSQSTNDVIPTAGKLTTVRLTRRLIDKLDVLYGAFYDKSQEFDGVLKMARTELQDAVPMRLGQGFGSYASAIQRSMFTMERSIELMNRVNLGATAIGTAINASAYYLKNIIPNLNKVCGLDVKMAANLFDATENLDYFVGVSHMLKSVAITLSKISNDLRLLSSGPNAGFGEIKLPPMQNGSSIMPGKINPVIPEVMNEVCFLVIGNDTTITMAAEAGQLELNAFEPILFYCLFQSLDYLANAIETFTVNCVSGITVDVDRCLALVKGSPALATALSPIIGYKKAAQIAMLAYENNMPVREVAISEGVSEEILDKLLRPMDMTMDKRR